MGNTAATLIGAATALSLALVLIWMGIRIAFARFRDVRDGAGRKRQRKAMHVTLSGDQSETNRIYDEERGLGVEWVRDEPPMERRSHFRLLIGDRAVPFSAYTEFGIDRAKRENPGLSVEEMIEMMSSDRVIVYRAYDIDADFDKSDFVQIWHQFLSSERPNATVGVIYSEINKANGSRVEWTKGV